MRVSLRHNSIFHLISVLVLIAAIFLAGCSRDPNVRKRKYFESGQRYFQKGKYREAIIQFGNAVRVDSSYADAHYQLAQSHLKLEQWRSAYEELVRTVDLQSDNYKAHLDLANLLIAGHDLKQAQEHVDLLLEKQPNDPLVHATAADLLSNEGNIPGAIVEAQKAIDLGPDKWEPYLGMALLRVRSNQPDLAEANFKKAIAINPKATPALLALAGFYQSHGRYSEAEQTIRLAIAADPKNPEPRSAQVRLYMSQGKQADAEEFLQHAVGEFQDDPNGYRMLGDFYFATGDIAKATTEYASLYRAHSQDSQVAQNYVQLLILVNRLDEARQINDGILKTNPTDENALICRAQIQNREGHPDRAVTTLGMVIDNDPNNAIAHYQLGLALNTSGTRQQAEAEWHDATRLKPDLVEAQQALADAAMREGDLTALEQYASKIIELRPQSPDGYALRAVSYINRREFARGADDVQKILELAPKLPVGYIQLGNLKLAQHQLGDAEHAFQQALSLGPNSPDALAGLMNTYLAGNQTDKAIAAANDQIAKVPNNSAFYDLLGTVLFNQKRDSSGAQGAFQKAIALDNHNTDALLKFGQLLTATGAVDQALATYQNAIKDNPHQPDFYTLAGGLYEARRDWEHAREMYQKALEISPENPLASNDLAYVMLRTGANVDVALALAQTARRGMPDSPNVADTLGWIFYQKGAYGSAIDLFQEALRLGQKNKTPENPTVHYHLGLAYEKTDQPALARQHLQRVLRIDPNYSDADDVKKQLAELAS